MLQPTALADIILLNNLVSMKRKLTRLFFYPFRYIELEFYVGYKFFRALHKEN